MTDTPPEPESSDPRIDAAGAELMAALNRMSAATGAPFDPSGILADARHTEVMAALVSAGVLDHDTAVGVELRALEAVTAMLDSSARAMQKAKREAILLEGVDRASSSLRDLRLNGGR